MINEVLVNTFKHAFTDQIEGEILVAISEEEKSVLVTISDDGKGIDEASKSNTGIKSLGFTLIKTLSAQLDGSYSFKNKTEGKGTIFTLRFKKEK